MQSSNSTTKVETLISVCTGRYGKIALELSNDAIRLLGYNDEQAITLAKAYQRELGQYLASNPIKSVKIGDKVDKHGMISLKEMADSCKGVITPTLALAKAVSKLNEASQWGVKFTQGMTWESPLHRGE